MKKVFVLDGRYNKRFLGTCRDPNHLPGDADLPAMLREVHGLMVELSGGRIAPYLPRPEDVDIAWASRQSKGLGGSNAWLHTERTNGVYTVISIRVANTGLAGVFLRAVIAHELMHYALDQYIPKGNKPSRPTEERLCCSAGFAVANRMKAGGRFVPCSRPDCCGDCPEGDWEYVLDELAIRMREPRTFSELPRINRILTDLGLLPWCTVPKDLQLFR